MLKSILSMLQSGVKKQKNHPGIRARRAQLEQLEDRRLLSITGVSDIAGLRAALDTFNGTSDDDTINVAAGTYTLSGSALDNANASGDLDITKTGGSLTIQGAGVGSTIIDANDVDRVLHITGATTVTLSDLTIQNGATDDDGTTSGQALGGGILISGAADVTLDNVTVTSNTATGLAGVANGSAGDAAYGGGIAIVNGSATLTLSDTSVAANTAVGGAGQTGTGGGSWTNGGTGGQGGAAGGGAIYVSSGDVVVTGTTSLTGNSATGGYGGTGGQGGYTTFAGWQGATGGAGGTSSGGGLFVSGGSLSVPTSGAITSNTATGGQGGNGGPGGTSMTTGSQGNGGAGGSAYGGGAYFTGGDMAAMQSGAVASNTVTAGIAGSGYIAGSNGSTSDADSGRQASTVSVTVEQAGGQSDPGDTSPINYTVTFSESVSNFATGDVSIGGTTGATTATVTGSGTTYNVAVSGMTSNGWVSIYLAAGVATNGGATPNAASFSADNVVQFSDTTAPTINSTTPTDNATGVDPAANLSVTFDENVAKGTGNISIYDSGDTLFEAIDVTSGQVTVSGATVTINPTGTLADLTGYYVQIDATAIDDTTGNSFAGISDTTTWSFTTADTTGPTISSTTPTDNATGVDPTANLSVTFDENVAKGTGNISIYDSGDTLFEAIDVTSGQVTVSGTTVTINPTGTLADLTGYYVQIDATAIDDTSGNSFAGISDTTTWSFTTADTTAPTISSTTPTDNATGVDPTANLSVTFNENVAKGTGNISIYDSSDTLFEAIDVTSGQVTVSGATATINPTGTLADLTGYYVQIDGTAIDDTSGNSFVGISDTTTWSFTTADTTAPTISSTTPTDNATAVDPTANLSVTFDENVANGTGNISIYDSGDTLFEAIDVTSGQVTVSGATVTINPTGTLADLTGYYVQIDATAIDDTSGNSFAGIGDTTTWSFTTADTTGPTISSTVPADNATGVDPTANLSVTFNENVAKGTGNISIYDSSDTLFEAIDVTSGQVTGSGATVTINPTGTLADLTGYYVQIDATAIDDTSGNSYAGISDTTTWSFTTADKTGPTISSTTPTNNATGVDPTANLSVTFNENVAKGTGNISIYDSSDTLFEAIDVTSGQVTVSGATVTINPTGTLADLTGYYVQIDATAIDDTSGNSFAGIGDTTTWSFTTADATAPTISSTTPTDNATGVDPTANLLVTFNENVAKGTGNISIYDSSDTLFEAIDVTSGQVTASGATVTINPTGTLADLTGYYVQIDATAIDDTSGNSFAGIGDTTTWSFTTGNTIQATDLGAVDYRQLSDRDATADAYYSFETVHDGQLSLVVGSSSAGGTSLELFDDSASSLATDATRIDWDVAAGETYYFQLTGGATIADVAIVNLLDDRTGGVVVYGSSGDDDFGFMPIGTTSIEGYLIAINDVEYVLQPGQITSILFDGLAGNDTADLTGTSGDDHVLMSPTSAVLTTDAFAITVSHTESISVAGGAGTADVAELIDSAGDDVFTGAASESTMVGSEYRNAVTGFEYTHAYAKSGGQDTAELEDTAGDDVFIAEANATVPVAKLIDAQGFVRTKFFDVTQANAVNGGTDEASFVDSAGDDHFGGGPGLSTMTTDACVQSAVGFEVVHAYAISGGTDVAELSDSSGDDTLVATDQYMKLYGDGFFVRAKRFDAAHGYARNGGNDSARLYGTAGDETFTGANTWAKMVGPATMQRVKFFDNVTAYGNGGTDKAYLYDSPGDDVLTSTSNSVTLTAPASQNVVQDFDWVRATSENGGTDYDRTEAVDFALEAVGDWIREVDEPTSRPTRSAR